MELPTTIRLTDAGAFLDGGTINLRAVTDLGEHVEILLNQHMYSGSQNPGRLLYGGNLIDVRSERETCLLRLIEDAEIQIKKGPRPDTDPTYIGPPIETIEAEEVSKIECIDELRTLVVDYVRSERYIDVAKHGIRP